VYDKRTKTIRLSRLRHLVLSNQHGEELKSGKQAVFRRVKGGGQKDQHLAYGKDKLIRNEGDNCLTPVNRVLKEDAGLTWEKCGEHETQQWEQNDMEVEKKPKAATKKTAPKKFSLVNPKGLRIFVSSTKQSTGFVAKIQSGNMGWRQEFTYDGRTKSIRVASLPTLALSNQIGMGLKTGKTIAFRTFNTGKDQVIKSSKDRIMNSDIMCLTAKEYKLNEGNTLSWWKCAPKNKPKAAQVWKTQWLVEHKKGTIKWNKKLTPIARDRFKSRKIPHRKRPVAKKAAEVEPVQEKKAEYKKPESNDKKLMNEGLWSYKFQIRAPQDTDFNVFMSAQEQGNGYVLKVNKQKNSWRSWFVYDHRTRSLRLEVDRRLSLSNHFAKGKDQLIVGKNAIMRKFENQVDQYILLKEKLIVNKADKCMTPFQYKLDIDNSLTWWHCKDLPVQKWVRVDSKWHGHDAVDKNEDRLRININEKTIKTLKKERKLQQLRKSQQKVSYSARIKAIKAAKKEQKKTEKAMIKQAESQEKAKQKHLRTQQAQKTRLIKLRQKAKQEAREVEIKKTEAKIGERKAAAQKQESILKAAVKQQSEERKKQTKIAKEVKKREDQKTKAMLNQMHKNNKRLTKANKKKLSDQRKDAAKKARTELKKQKSFEKRREAVAGKRQAALEKEEKIKESRLKTLAKKKEELAKTEAKNLRKKIKNQTQRRKSEQKAQIKEEKSAMKRKAANQRASEKQRSITEKSKRKIAAQKNRQELKGIKGLEK